MILMHRLLVAVCYCNLEKEQIHTLVCLIFNKTSVVIAKCNEFSSAVCVRWDWVFFYYVVFLTVWKIPLSVHLCPMKVTSCLKNLHFSGCNLRLCFLHKSKTFARFLIKCFSNQPMTIRSSIYKNACEGSIPENAIVIILWKEFGAIFKP